MIDKHFYSAVAISLGVHAVIAGLLIFSSGPFGIKPREGKVVSFEITLSDGPPAAADSAVSRQEPARAHIRTVPKKQKSAEPAGRPRGGTPDFQPVVLASLGTLSDAAAPGKSAGSVETGAKGYSADRVQGPKISAAVVLPRYRETVRPEYPWIARVRGYEGMVLLSAEILGNGNVGKLAVKRSSGFALLDQSALDTVRNWKFEPGRESGGPASMWVEVPVRFTLKD